MTYKPHDKRPDSRRYCLAMHPEQLKRIDELARKRLSSRSALIRQSIEDYLTREEEDKAK